MSLDDCAVACRLCANACTQQLLKPMLHLLHVAPLSASIHEQAVRDDVGSDPRLLRISLLARGRRCTDGLLHLLQPVDGAIQIVRADAHLDHSIVQMREIRRASLDGALQPYFRLLVRRGLVPGADHADERLGRIVAASERRLVEPLIDLAAVHRVEAALEQAMVAVRIRRRPLRDRGGQCVLGALPTQLEATATRGLGDEGVHYGMHRAPGGTNPGAQDLLHPIGGAVDIPGFEASLDDDVRPGDCRDALRVELGLADRAVFQELAQLRLGLGPVTGPASLDNGVHVRELEKTELGLRLLLGRREAVELHHTARTAKRHAGLPSPPVRVATDTRLRDAVSALSMQLPLLRHWALPLPPCDDYQPCEERTECGPLDEVAVALAFNHSEDELVEQPEHDRGNTCDHQKPQDRAVEILGPLAHGDQRLRAHPCGTGHGAGHRDRL
mmetsp:Transcript_52291/g.150624  ORF Transcript_52291/g.150624 Transcript_52291/m.150624 type:complete len:443 (-) Transcript_52291:139-1467(-)